MKPTRLLLASALATLAAGVSHAFTFATDFSGADNTVYTGNFSSSAATGTWGATSGVNGGAGVATSNNLSISLNTSLGDIGATETVDFSIYFRVNPSLASTGSGAKLGFFGLSNVSATDITNSNTGMGTATAGEGLFGIGFQTSSATTSGVTSVRWRTSTSFEGTPTVSTITPGASPATFNVTNGNWYKFTVSYTTGATSGTNWTLNSTIQDFGATGGVAGATLSTATNTLLNTTATTAVFNASNVYSIFSFDPKLSAFDNYSISSIPEPQTYALVAALLAGSVVVLRRRRAVSR